MHNISLPDSLTKSKGVDEHQSMLQRYQPKVETLDSWPDDIIALQSSRVSLQGPPHGSNPMSIALNTARIPVNIDPLMREKKKPVSITVPSATVPE
jgi:hypothetical protein